MRATCCFFLLSKLNVHNGSNSTWNSKTPTRFVVNQFRMFLLFYSIYVFYISY